MDEVVFIDRAADVALNGSVVRVKLCSGDRCFHLAIPIHIFLANYAKSGEVVRQWKGGEVIQFAAGQH